MQVRLTLVLGLAGLGACNCEQGTGGLEGALGDAAPRDSTMPDAIATQDAGVADGGDFDAGSSDGAIACNAPSECGPPPTRDDPWCGANGHVPGSWSCVANVCYWECRESRICRPEVPDCLACTDAAGTAATSCPVTQCMFAWSSARVASTNCTGDPALVPFEGGILTLSQGAVAPCATNVVFQGGTQLVATIRQLEDGSQYGIFPGLGGLCLGQNLFTGAERWHWSCAGCEMTWELQ